MPDKVHGMKKKEISTNPFYMNTFKQIFHEIIMESC